MIYSIVGPVLGLGDKAGKVLSLPPVRYLTASQTQPPSPVYFAHDEAEQVGHVLSYSWEAPSSAIWAVCLVDAAEFEIADVHYYSARAKADQYADQPGAGHHARIVEVSLVASSSNKKAAFRVYEMDVLRDERTSWPTVDIDGDKMPKRVRELLVAANATQAHLWGFKDDINIAGLTHGVNVPGTVLGSKPKPTEPGKPGPTDSHGPADTARSQVPPELPVFIRDVGYVAAVDGEPINTPRPSVKQ